MKQTPTTVLTPQTSKEMIDTLLASLISDRAAQSAAINPHYQTLWRSIEKLYGAGGKRLRPFMTLLVFEALSQRPVEDAVPAAAAQELLHLAMLIHDDIIDRDTIRYGIKNVTGQFMDNYQDLLPDTQDQRHYAESAAILAGDLLISEVYLLIAQINADSQTILKVQRLLSEATFNVIGGQLLDTEASFRGEERADPLVIAEQKTASYSFISPFLTGATLAGAPQEHLDLLRELGEKLGIAYQLRDDMIGVFGDQTVTGKSSDGDIKEGKRTMLVDEFYRRATPQAKEQFEVIFGNANATADQIEELRALLNQSGAVDAIETMIRTYRDQTLDKLENLPMDDAHREAFQELINYCLKRDF